jgi:uncharacterized protein (UPF0276 family)
MPGVFGFGLDYKYGARYPGGIEGLCERYRDRLSHLSIVAVETADEARHFRRLAGSLPVIHHLSNVAPGNPSGPDLERLRKQDAFSGILEAVWCGEDIGVWQLGPYPLPYFAPPVFDADVARWIGEGVIQITERSRVPFLVETPSCSYVAGTIDLGEFFRTITDTAGCPIVLDVSHVFSYALAVERPALEVLAGIPLERVWEIHIAGGRVDDAHPFRYVDSHSDPIMSGVYEVLTEAVRSCRNLRCVTYELGVGLTSEMIEHDVAKLERILRGASMVPDFSIPQEWPS